MSNFLYNVKTGFVALVTLMTSFFSAPPLADTTPLPTIPNTDEIIITSQNIPANPTPLSEEEVSTDATLQAIQTESDINTQTSRPTENYIPASLPTPIPPDWNRINERARSATVNILCTSKAGGLFQPISGSGVFIDARGIILTNAHVAQYLFLKDYPKPETLDCMIRQGSPATARYRARVMYISATWVTLHHEDILVQVPTGTGEYDFALLVVTERTNPKEKLPEQFPYLKLGFIDDPDVKYESVIVSAYPAGFLGGITIQTSLFLTTASTFIHDIYTFVESSIDALSLGGNVNAQQGSSGGGVISRQGELVGIITTSTDAPSTGARDLNAITLSHINRELEAEIGFTLPKLLEENPNAVAESFSTDVAPALLELYTQTLTKSGR